MTKQAISLLLILVFGAVARGADSPDFDRDVAPFFEQHCVRCHGEKRQKGDFRIDTLSKDVGTGHSVNHWLEVIEKINSAEMPPDDEPELPTAEEASAITEWLAARIDEGEAVRLATREAVSFHRLSREEYANTVYDLLGVNFDVTDPTGLTEDSIWHGFERIGSVLSLSASHVEKYFAAAETILAEAYPEKPTEPFLVRKKALDLRGGPSKEQIAKLEEQGIADKVRVDMWPGHNLQGGRPGPGKRFEVGGEFKVRLQVSGLKPKGGRAPHLKFYADKLDRILYEQDILAPEDEPVVIEFQTHLPAGSHSFRVVNDVPGPSILPRSGRPGRKPFFSLAEGRIPWQLKLTDEEGVPLYPFLILDWIEWEGPIITDDAKARRDGYVAMDGKTADQARAGLEKFAKRAFRRPPTEAEITKYLELIDSEIEAGSDFVSAVKTAMLGILCSKDFLYIVEGSTTDQSGTINDWELATRLAYFLWSTMPDEELFALAEAGTLHETGILQGQVARMLDDPKARRFAEGFPRQWFQLQKVGMFTPDSKLYPEYDKYLERSMIRETTAFFAEVLEKNLSLKEFLDSDWTMMNPRLAMHYGLPQPDQDVFQRVSLLPEHNRGGILTQASILSLTSDGTRHRPVHRGVWVMESIFGKSPPPPPANVDPIEPNPVDSPKATVRMKLEAHKADPNCASCHQKIDPLGIAFDNYDAIGRWREVEKVQNGVGDDPKVDASGELADGRAFTGPEEFKALLEADLDAFNATFVKKMATYALRRTMSVDDRSDLANIAESSKESGYRLRSAVEAFVLSDLFQTR